MWHISHLSSHSGGAACAAPALRPAASQPGSPAVQLAALAGRCLRTGAGQSAAWIGCGQISRWQRCPADLPMPARSLLFASQPSCGASQWRRSATALPPSTAMHRSRCGPARHSHAAAWQWWTATVSNRLAARSQVLPAQPDFWQRLSRPCTGARKLLKGVHVPGGVTTAPLLMQQSVGMPGKLIVRFHKPLGSSDWAGCVRERRPRQH